MNPTGPNSPTPPPSGPGDGPSPDASAGSERVPTPEEQAALALHARGVVLELKGDHSGALKLHRRAAKMLVRREVDAALMLPLFVLLANLEYDFKNYMEAEVNYRRVVKFARLLGDEECLAEYAGRLARVVMIREDWTDAEALAGEALRCAIKFKDEELIAFNNQLLARSLLKQGRQFEALTHATAAVRLCIRIGSPNLALAQAMLKECQA